VSKSSPPRAAAAKRSAKAARTSGPKSGARPKDPCPFDPTQEQGGACKYGERCPRFMRRGKRRICLGKAGSTNYLSHVVAAKVLLEQ